MARVAPVIPAETDLLCEKCGYTLNGLPDDSRCPECGAAVTASAAPNRAAASWEVGAASLGSFWGTTARAVFGPTDFYRTLLTRRDERRALRFARIHWWLAAWMLGIAAQMHAVWFLGLGSPLRQGDVIGSPGLLLCFVIALYFALSQTTGLAALLTHWEASYRGLRLPATVIRRGLYFHAAHYFPVSLLVLLTIGGFRLLLATDQLGIDSGAVYLYTLCGEVVLFAGYLFHTYWIGMRNMMYANK